MNQDDFQEYMKKVYIHFTDNGSCNLGVSIVDVLTTHYPEYKNELDREKRHIAVSPYYDERNLSTFLKWLIDKNINDKLVEFIVVEKDFSDFGDIVAICSNIKNAEEIIARINSDQRFIYQVKKGKYTINQRVRI